jgi:hypothetical protein
MFRQLCVVGIACTVALCGCWPLAHTRAQTLPAPKPTIGRETNAFRMEDLAAQLAGPLRREHLPTLLRSEDGIVATRHINYTKVHLTDKTGKESAHLTEVAIPASDGMCLDLQFLAGKVLGQAVRPQDLRKRYRTQSEKRIEWNTHLDQFWFKKANGTLLLNFDYGTQVNRKQVDRIVAAVRSYAVSHGAIEGQPTTL